MLLADLLRQPGLFQLRFNVPKGGSHLLEHVLHSQSRCHGGEGHEDAYDGFTTEKAA